MKIDLALKRSLLGRLGEFLTAVGFAVFALTFWMPGGFFLGGDPTFLGGFRPELEIVFPVGGLGIFLVFFGQLLANQQKRLSRAHMVFLLSFLGLGAVGALFSAFPQHSILYLILWATGILAASFGGLFFVTGTARRTIFFIGILLGTLASISFPEFGISAELLGIAATLGIIFSVSEGNFPARWALQIFYAWVAIQSGNMAIVLAALFALFTARRWFGRTKKGKTVFWVPAIFLLALTGWGIFEGVFSLPQQTFIPHFFDSIKNIIFGVGEGQFLPALQEMSDVFLTPESLRLPQSGAVVTFFERGSWGTFLILALIFSPLFFREKKLLFPSLLLAFFWLSSFVLVASEAGILFLMVFLFAASPKGKFVNKIS